MRWAYQPVNTTALEPVHDTTWKLCLSSQACLRVMFTAILGGFMDHQFGLDVKRALLRPMVEGSIEMFLRISQELLPTPAKAHYTFNLRDLSKVFQGLLMIKARQVGCMALKKVQPSGE